MTPQDRAKKIEEGIRLVFASLESHLEWTHHKTSEGELFHKKTVKEYVRLLQLLSELY